VKAEFYRDKSGDWRWRLRARNGRCVAESGEGYRRLIGAARGLRTVLRQHVNPVLQCLTNVQAPAWRRATNVVRGIEP
jgi:uncharacterized protein